jgi:hypothetical protein
MRISSVASALLLVLLAAPAVSQSVLIEGFENGADWVVAGNDITTNAATAAAATNTADKMQGAGSVALTYNYSGNLYYEVGITKTFSSPVDLSDAQEILVDIKGDANSESDLIWYGIIRDGYGQSFKMYAGAIEENGKTLHAPKADGWKTYTFSVAELNWNNWGNAAFVPARLNDIVSVTFFLQYQSGDAADTTTVLFDNLRYNTTTTRVSTTVIDTFDYAGDTELTTAWNGTYGGSTSNTVLTRDAVNVAEGTAAANFQFNMGTGAQNFATGKLLPLGAPVDLTEAIAFELLLDGDADFPAASGPILMVGIEDTAVQRTRWYANNGLKTEGYKRLIMYPWGNAGQWGDVNAWSEDVWDADAGATPGTPSNKASVQKYFIALIDGAADVYPYSVDIKVDGFKYYTSNSIPFESNATGEGPTAIRNWSLY